MKTWTKSLLIAICLVILNISYATAKQTSPPKPDSTVTEETEISYHRQGSVLFVYQQVTTNTKVVHEAETTNSYILIGDTEFWDKHLWTIEYMIKQGTRRDTMDYNYDWQSIKLVSPWALVRYGSENSKIVEFSPENKNFNVRDLRTPAQERLNDDGGILIPLFLLGFVFFLIMPKINKFHLLLYYLMALTFLSFMATFDGFWLLTAIGVGGSIAVAIYSAKKWDLDFSMGFWIFFFHGLAFLSCYMQLEKQQLTETTINYWHFNALLISYIVSGKIIAWASSMIGRLIHDWIKRMDEADRLKRRSEAADRLKKLQQED